MSFQKELGALLNRHSMENASDTPDFILADYLIGCLRLWNETTQSRDAWYGMNPQPGTDWQNDVPEPPRNRPPL